MAVFQAVNEEGMILSCECGCDEGLKIKVDKDPEVGQVFYQTYLSGNWYKEQGGFFKKLKKIWKILCGKDYYYSEIVLNEKDWEAYKNWINQY